MAKVFQIEKANPNYKGHVIEDVEIRIHKSIDFDKEEDPTDIFYHDAEELFDALRVLPGGTFDRLLILMLQKTASSFVVPHSFHDEKPPSSMLALLEKAYPIIEEEAERRERVKDLSRIADPYWTEMGELRDAISAEIDKAYGKGVKQDG